MKIVNIFAHRLFALHYNEEADNEYDRLLDLWDDAEYIYEFLKDNKADIPKHRTLAEMAEFITEDAIELDETLVEITQSDDKTLSYFFKPLHNQEYHVKILSFQKGRQYYLRMYAIKIDEDTFVITGGAIKLPSHHLMEDRIHTKKELGKLENAKNYFRENGVFDEDSFFEFLSEN